MSTNIRRMSRGSSPVSAGLDMVDGVATLFFDVLFATLF